MAVVQSRSFMRKCEGKYRDDEIDALVEEISRNPRLGKKLTAAGNLYQHHWSRAEKSKHEYDVYYVFNSKSQPLLLVSIFKRGTKAVLDHGLATLAEEITSPGS